MKETELWRRLNHHLGESYARTWAAEQSLPALGSRTVLQALGDGEPTKQVWRAVWLALELPDSER